MWNGFRKREISRFEGAIAHIKESLADDTHDFWSALFCSGITFTDEVRRFYDYVKIIGLLDFAETIRKQHPNWDEEQVKILQELAEHKAIAEEAREERIQGKLADKII